jgi:hypothetical protein
MTIARLTPRRVLGAAVSRAVAWAEASHQGSCRNALWSSLAMADERRRRAEVDAFLEAHHRDRLARDVVDSQVEAAQQDSLRVS